MDGLLIIDKPAGLTSHDVVARVRSALQERRVGHTGTLDPFATGVMVVLVGRATRLAQFLAGAEKEYEALVRLGLATETGDATGAPRATPAARCSWSEAEIEAVLAKLRGEIAQVPPMYSAKKVEGRKLYELARRGETIERRPVNVLIRTLAARRQADGRLLRVSPESGTCDLEVRVVCSAGTYVRVLAETIGEQLGTGAHLAALRRTRAGAFGLGKAPTLEQLAATADDREALEAVIISPAAALSEMPAVHLNGEAAGRARHGMALRAERFDLTDLCDGQQLKLLDDEGLLVAVATYDAAHQLMRPRVCLAAEK